MGTALIGHFQAMAGNNAWSNHRLLRACARVAPGDFAAPRTGFFPSLAGTLNHILMVDGYYIDSLHGRDDAMDRAMAFVARADFADLDAAQRASDRRLTEFCDRLMPAAIDRAIVLRRPNREAPLETIAAVLAHLFVHQIHHRGQAHAMLSDTLVKPPQLDEFFLRDELSLRREELRTLGLPEI